MKKIKFATCINCIDGRTLEPILIYLKRKYKVADIDMITEAGAAKVLSLNKNKKLINSIKNRVMISIEKHNSNIIAIAGHYDCAGNPVSTLKHISQIKKSIKIIKNWNFKPTVIGIWINKKFKINEI